MPHLAFVASMDWVSGKRITLCSRTCQQVAYHIWQLSGLVACFDGGEGPCMGQSPPLPPNPRTKCAEGRYRLA
eukprot:1077717-Pyramimonas_sp.AAC.1